MENNLEKARAAGITSLTEKGSLETFDPKDTTSPESRGVLAALHGQAKDLPPAPKPTEREQLLAEIKEQAKRDVEKAAGNAPAKFPEGTDQYNKNEGVDVDVSDLQN